MRLSRKEIEALKYALEDVKYDKYLFGSRVDDKKRGGDIDILIDADISTEERFRFCQKIAKRFFSKCEEKIDVVVINKNRLSKNEKAFLEVIQLEKINSI